MIRFYELTYLISPQVSEEELKSLQERITSLVQREGGFINEMQMPIKKRLAFSIKKNSEAFLVGLNFSLTSEKLNNLEKQLKSEKEILRYLILSKKMLKKEAVSMKPRRAIKPRPKPKEKVELKEIEKKLEEILKE